MIYHSEEYWRLCQEISTSEDVLKTRQLCKLLLNLTEPAAAGAIDTPELFLEKLLSEVVEDAPQLWDKIVQKCYRDYVVAVIAPDETREIMPEHRTIFRDLPDTWVFPYRGRLVLMTADPRDTVNATSFRASLRQAKLSAGLSRPFSDLVHLKTAYHEALDTLKTIQILRHSQTMAGYDDFLMIRLLDKLEEGTDLGAFCLPDIQALQLYDQTHESELCRTLLCYLEHAKNISNTASDLNIHRNTVHYRINRSMEILKKIDFSNDYMAFLLMLSLYIAEYEYYRTRRDQAKAAL